MLTFAAFFSLGFGEALQFRYWIVQVTLGLVLIVALLAELLPQLARSWATPMLVAAGLTCLLLYPLFVDVDFYRKVLGGWWLAAPPPPLSEAVMGEVDARLGSGEAALMDTRAGIYYWSGHPEDRVVAFPSRLFRVIGPEPTLRFVREYNVRYAVYPAGRAGLSTLESVGFVETLRSGDQVLLEYRGG